MPDQRYMKKKPSKKVHKPAKKPARLPRARTYALVLSGGKWTPHDLRRTGATLMADLGALPDVIEKCLNHTEGKKVKRIYQRAKYSKPMRDAWVMLGDRLNLLQAQARGVSGNVIPLSRAA